MRFVVRKRRCAVGAGPLSDFYLTVSADAVQLSQQNAARQALEIAWSGGADDGSTRYTLEIGIDGEAPAGAGSWVEELLPGRACLCADAGRS